MWETGGNRWKTTNHDLPDTVTEGDALVVFLPDRPTTGRASGRSDRTEERG